MIKGLSVDVRNGDFNGAMRRFKKKVQEAGVLQEIRERQEYTKPSEKRKKEKAAGRARWLKKLRKQNIDRDY
jgi:small subunit ribosomal protein S21